MKDIQYGPRKEAIRQAIQDGRGKIDLSGEVIVVDLTKGLDTKNSTFGRWVHEYEEMGETAFPDNGNPRSTGTTRL